MDINNHNNNNGPRRALLSLPSAVRHAYHATATATVTASRPITRTSVPSSSTAAAAAEQQQQQQQKVVEEASAFCNVALGNVLAAAGGVSAGGVSAGDTSARF